MDSPAAGTVARDSLTLWGDELIAKRKNPASFAKRQREQEKKRKADEKVARRVRNKQQASEPPAQEQRDAPLE